MRSAQRLLPALVSFSCTHCAHADMHALDHTSHHMGPCFGAARATQLPRHSLLCAGELQQHIGAPVAALRAVPPCPAAIRRQRYLRGYRVTCGTAFQSCSVQRSDACHRSMSGRCSPPCSPALTGSNQATGKGRGTALTFTTNFGGSHMHCGIGQSFHDSDSVRALLVLFGTTWPAWLLTFTYQLPYVPSRLAQVASQARLGSRTHRSKGP